MPRLFYGNFDFEERLSHSGQRASIAVLKRCAALQTAWLLIAEPGDQIDIADGPLPDVRKLPSELGLGDVRFVDDRSIDAGAEFVPWGWDEEAIAWAERHRLVVNPPPMDVIRLANSREYSLEFERTEGSGLRGQRLCSSMEDLESALPVGDWIIKANLSGAGRDRITGRGWELNDQQRGWILRQFRVQGIVALEPRANRLDEAGIQWQLERDHTYRCLGVTQLLVDNRGQYRGSMVGSSPATSQPWQSAVETGEQVVADLSEKGYFGPVGIDAMRYLDQDQRERIRPLQDINARWTMGRLALGATRWSRTGETVTVRQRFNEPTESGNGRVIALSDVRADLPGPAFSLTLEFAPDAELQEIEGNRSAIPARDA
jgi:hypothetical protein